MTTKPRGRGLKALVARPLRKKLLLRLPNPASNNHAQQETMIMTPDVYVSGYGYYWSYPKARLGSGLKYIRIWEAAKKL